jgi:hypothetical protein
MRIKLLALLFPLLVGVSCGKTGTGDAQSLASGDESSLSEATSSDEACLFGYDDKLDQLLDREMIQQAYPLPKDAKFEYSKVMKGYHQAEFTWPSDRTRKISVGTRTMDVPMSNRIGIGQMKKYKDDQNALGLFKASYRTMTEAEKARAKEDIKRGLDEHTSKDGEKLSTTQKNVGKGLASSFMDAVRYEPIAAWELSEQALMVLVGKTQFRISAEVGANTEENLKIAKALAQLVLAKCQ